MMTQTQSLAVFEDRQVRRVYDEASQTWFFSVVDVVGALTDSVNPTDYLKKMRKRDETLASYVGTNCPYVGMLSNGKLRQSWTKQN